MVSNITGYEAQGHAVAASLIGYIKAHAGDLRRIVHSLWALEDNARQAAHKALTQFRNEARKNAVSTLAYVEGYSKKDWQRMANSANTRASQMQTIIRAMRIGMTPNTIEDALKIPDPENVGFDVVYQCAKTFLASQAKSNAGRKPDAWEVKLRKWLDKNQPSTDEAEAQVKFEKIRLEILTAQ